MPLFLIAWLGGVLTIVSPCILPVLPFVFARTERPFVRSGLPLLIGMAIAFSAVGALAAVGGGWAVAANQYGRIAALVLLAVFGVALLFPSLADYLSRPVVALGARLSASADDPQRAGGGFGASLLLGVATGMLWAPCAGPILGLILTGAALQGASVHTSLLLLAYAAGAATSLALALIAGQRVFAAMKRSLGVGEWIRRGLGIAVLAGVAAIALHADTGVLARLSLAGTNQLEQGLLDRLRPASDHMASASMQGSASMQASASMRAAQHAPSAALPVEGELPSLDGAVQWLNSPPLTAAALRGKVVLVDFWTYSCINCLRALPYVKAWADKYRANGLVVIGVHAPEFAFEKDIGNVRRAVADLKIDYPVAIDNRYAIWRAFDNQYWPAHYFVDANGKIRHHHFGEGDYRESEQTIRQLLTEAGARDLPAGFVTDTGTGAEAPPAMNDMQSPETYLGYERAHGFASPGEPVADRPHDYAAGPLDLNQWALAGTWTLGAEHADLDRAGGGIVYRFHARDLHLVLGPAGDGKPVRFRVTVDGKPPGADHGADVDANGYGTVTGQRLYQLIRQQGAVADRTFEIRFLDPGVHAYSFTFG
ncbi:cytochrome c biogenesis protein DipZ [Paraburkholderia caballeronis]|uniref:Cytochrome c biogenesis protein CcdA n=1 Tax=Paraburkholderia caballeronis TaxID=416943 RepID=A0A1H7QBX9_9BURK|nr:cytochrome c biogenesis protein DipZ [Paraburkholderia caballeronis]PXW16379.1 cytochrome c biogenesis protein CcdA [Paraburkholderia caballeronis]PXW94056.1 cytochrome c biogenesis protein CcdA [Paraburkholderia caballeronis]RAJ89120.1 cytochrome c biogenesis protein CcdA [Paraburkholderia caballeronis]SEE10384.1 Cytochrome c biogenesis protein CcdA [Paraburkholderia caballeronis]SEL45258.1 Cytochrome c biogenesis protein CcdA [Paraburkholderia caballeronis]